jgi:hypothetical protein
MERKYVATQTVKGGDIATQVGDNGSYNGSGYPDKAKATKSMSASVTENIFRIFVSDI